MFVSINKLQSVARKLAYIKKVKRFYETKNDAENQTEPLRSLEACYSTCEAIVNTVIAFSTQFLFFKHNLFF